jgi:cytochrome P450
MTEGQGRGAIVGTTGASDRTEAPSSDLGRPPGPAPSRTDIAALRRNPMRYFERVAGHGDLVFFHLGPLELYLAVHPDYIRDVLVTNNRRFEKRTIMSALLGNGLLTSEGDLHRRQRRLIQPAFHHTRIAAYGDVMVEYADRARSRWRDGQELDIHAEMIELTLAIVGKTLFDTDVEKAEAEGLRTSLTTAMNLYGEISGPFGPMATGDSPQVRRFEEAVGELDGFVFQMIEDRRQSGDDHGDLLSMLLLMADEGGGMSDQQLRDEALTLVGAGHETTANALTWAWYLLGQNPEVEARLHLELDRVLAGRLPRVQDLPALEYVRRVMAESLRIFPPVPYLHMRRALAEHRLGEYVIPKGSHVVMSPHLAHRDPRWWPEPDRFDPDRWKPDLEASRPKFSFFPFGGGSRLCLGEPFAWMEGVLLLAIIAQQWRCHLVPDHPVVPRVHITQRPEHGIKVTVERRA